MFVRATRPRAASSNFLIYVPFVKVEAGSAGSFRAKDGFFLTDVDTLPVVWNTQAESQLQDSNIQ